MDSWPSVFSFYLVGWWAGVSFALIFHFTIFYISAKYATHFDGTRD